MQKLSDTELIKLANTCSVLSSGVEQVWNLNGFDAFHDVVEKRLNAGAHITEDDTLKQLIIARELFKQGIRDNDDDALVGARKLTRQVITQLEQYEEDLIIKELFLND